MAFKYYRRNFLNQTTAAGAEITLLQSPLKNFAAEKISKVRIGIIAVLLRSLVVPSGCRIAEI